MEQPTVDAPVHETAATAAGPGHAMTVRLRRWFSSDEPARFERPATHRIGEEFVTLAVAMCTTALAVALAGIEGTLAWPEALMGFGVAFIAKTALGGGIQWSPDIAQTPIDAPFESADDGRAGGRSRSVWMAVVVGAGAYAIVRFGEPAMISFFVTLLAGLTLDHAIRIIRFRRFERRYGIALYVPEGDWSLEKVRTAPGVQAR